MSTTALDPQMTVNEIITRQPAAVAVFSSYGIDSCCGGAKPLAEVALRHDLDLDALLEALRTAEATP